MSRALAAVAASLVGRRVELAPHVGAWMAGDRYGTVLRVTSRGLTVRLDRSGATVRGLTDEEVSRWVD